MAGSALLKGTNPRGNINSRAAHKIEKLLIMFAVLLHISQLYRCGLLIFSNNRNHFRPLWSAVFNLSAGICFLFIILGNQSSFSMILLKAIKKIIAPNTVLKPGIDTGIKKIIVSNAVNSNMPSFPNKIIISDNPIYLFGIFSIMLSTLLFSDSCNPEC